VIENTNSGKVIGSAAPLMKQKIIQGLAGVKTLCINEHD